MNFRSTVFVMVLVLGLALGGCNTPAEPVASSPAPTVPAVVTPVVQAETTAVVSQNVESAYPGTVTTPPNADLGSYPAPELPERIHPRTQFPDGPLTTPSAKADTGVVRGRLKAEPSVELVLFTGDIYLAPVIYMEGEIRVPFLSLDETTDPKASLRNSDNEFIVTDVPPGEYGVIVHTPVSDIVVPEAEYGFLIIEVVAGEVIDLGDLTVE